MGKGCQVSRGNGETMALLLRHAARSSPRPAGTPGDEAPPRWSDNCNDPSRIAQSGGNVRVLTKEKCQAVAERNGWSIERAKGFVDGETCRLRGRKPSKYALVGIDEYSLGFRTGFYERRNGASVTSVSRATTDPV